MSKALRRRLPARELDLMVQVTMPESLDIQCFDDGTINLYRRVCRGFHRKFYKKSEEEVGILRHPDLELIAVLKSPEDLEEKVRCLAG